MELLFIRHGQSEHNIRIVKNLDSYLTGYGREQATDTAIWLRNNFDFTGYSGIISPYLRTLQTANIIWTYNQLDFDIHLGCREHLITDFSITNYTEEFSHFKWVNLGESIPFIAESPYLLIERLQIFLNSLSDKCCIISHEMPIRVMTDLCLGHPVEQIAETINEICTTYNTKTAVRYSSVPNCSLTWVKDGECVFKSKVVYE